MENALSLKLDVFIQNMYVHPHSPFPIHHLCPFSFRIIFTKIFRFANKICAVLETKHKQTTETKIAKIMPCRCEENAVNLTNTS